MKRREIGLFRFHLFSQHNKCLSSRYMFENLKVSYFVVILSGLTGFIPMNAQHFRMGSVGSLKSTAFDSKSEVLYTIFQDSIVAYSGDGELSSQKVTDILGSPDFSEGHNTKLKNQVIETLNLKLKTLLDSEKVVIQASRSKTDRRNKSYTLDISVFNAQT